MMVAKIKMQWCQPSRPSGITWDGDGRKWWPGTPHAGDAHAGDAHARDATYQGCGCHMPVSPHSGSPHAVPGRPRPAPADVCGQWNSQVVKQVILYKIYTQYSVNCIHLRWYTLIKPCKTPKYLVSAEDSGCRLGRVFSSSRAVRPSSLSKTDHCRRPSDGMLDITV
jgi:hypothetical protein